MLPSHQRRDCEVAIIGAGPYGLSAAAHLKAAHVDVRVFGDTMSFWRDHMPKGMYIRSAWQATNLSDPGRHFTLDRFAEQHGFQRPDLLPLEDLVAYGEWFQRSAVPDVDGRKVARIEAYDGGYRLTLGDGSRVTAGRIVIATGLAHQEFKPQAFDGLPAALVSHSADHADFARFRGQRVAVVGRGQSACESAAILSECGAEVELIARGEVNWLGSSKTASDRDGSLRWRIHQLLAAPSGVGPFPVSWLNEFPNAVRLLPQALRNRLNALSLRAGATAWLKPRFERVRIMAGSRIAAAHATSAHVSILFPETARAYDHVVLATGYHIDIAKLGLFDADLLGAIRRIDGSPRLAAGFESTARGLHFLGANAVMSYGPLMRFIAGSGFAAREVTRAIVAQRPSVGARRVKQPALAKTTEAVSR